ncbi:synphilin-1 [Sinocyclocheilus grahami]|uniref:synphilin-1 n=1 Tax=Sinocyclocheilus grahami TaxID=75366 RepID=UPI0007ACDE2A|nr:PREDICTED: synphilin-1 [Sinocyclocheilus grahami]
MDVPEYLDLDEIDFTDDLPYKSIPELCRRHDGANDERQAPSINWARSAASHGGAGIKPTGVADVYSKFRPVKRVSPLKHQPQESEPEAEGKSSKEDKSRGLPMNGALFGELEHYDLDMDEILDVPYIKSSQQTASLKKRSAGGKGATLVLSESLLSPVSWPHMRKSKSVDQDYLRAQSAHGSEPDLDKPDGGSAAFPLQPAKGPKQDKPWRTFGEADEEAKKTQNILNIVREGQISLLPHLAAENLERIRDEDGNNLLHVSAAQGHADCLQHLTSLMGEDCLNERNTQQLTPAGLAVRVRHTHTQRVCMLQQGLPHLAAENLERIRDEDGNNLLHVSAAQGHADCLQHLTSLMGEDCLNERNTQQLTPAGLAVRVRHTHTQRVCMLQQGLRPPDHVTDRRTRVLQERVLLWLLQFMQEQAISLDEADQNGNTAVHVAAQFGHLSCVQTLVEYGSNVTVQNQQGERPSQNAERQGHSTCSRYLVVVETCMSLASQVVKLTKQLQEQTTARVALQNQLQLLPQTHELKDRPPSPSSRVESGPEMTLTAEAAPDNIQRHMDSDTVLCKLLGKEPTDVEAEPGAEPMRRLEPGERRDLKLARLKQIMQRSLSESDAEESKPPRPERPTQLPITEHAAKFSFTHRTSKSVDVYNPSPSSDHSDPEAKTEVTGELPEGQKVTTSPKSALKSPSSRRKTSQNLKLRVTFDEPPRKDGPFKVQPGKDKPESSKRAFGTLRSIMETLSGNQNSNNNNAPKHAGTSGKKSKSKTSAV